MICACRRLVINFEPLVFNNLCYCHPLLWERMKLLLVTIRWQIEVFVAYWDPIRNVTEDVFLSVPMLAQVPVSWKLTFFGSPKTTQDICILLLISLKFEQRKESEEGIWQQFRLWWGSFNWPSYTNSLGFDHWRVDSQQAFQKGLHHKTKHLQPIHCTCF